MDEVFMMFVTVLGSLQLSESNVDFMAAVYVFKLFSEKELSIDAFTFRNRIRSSKGGTRSGHASLFIVIRISIRSRPDQNAA